MGYAAIKDAATDADWRDGASRFIVVLGDQDFKTGPDAGDTQAGTLAALAGDPGLGDDISLIGLSFGTNFTTSMTGLGADVYASSTDPADIVADIIAGIGAAFEEYTEVTVSDLGAGLPGISVSTVCTGADIGPGGSGGTCIGDTAVGKYDRSIDRTFTFDVTFKREEAGDISFGTHALVDGRIVATEKDRFTDAGVIPLPATAWMLLAGIGGLGALRRRKKS